MMRSSIPVLMLALLATSATTRTTLGEGRTVPAATVLPPPPAPVRSLAPWAKCAAEGKTCHGSGWGEIRYGVEGRWRRVTVAGDVACGNDKFGDPAPDTVKHCQRRAVDAPLLPAAVTPIASNFDTASLVGSGFERNGSFVPPSARPDVVGAFRMICTSGQLNYDDPILYPGVKGGSPHLHQWYGNTVGDYASTYARLRAAGDSSCSNRLNRSAYWVPALLNAAGKVIQPDYVSLYYKRRPAGDPECLRIAAKGCVGLPTGLRAVSGFDMARMGEEQPENATYSFRCISPGKPSEHRGTTAAALADCGGSGQIAASIHFGDCWTGTLDSADHRAHLGSGSYGSWGYYRCPAAYPFVIPQLTQTVAYTIAPTDGEVWFASDRMNGMRMPGGATFHADYMEAWDPPTRVAWERECVGKLLNCSDGELGDGRMMKRGGLTYKAATRLINAPAR